MMSSRHFITNVTETSVLFLNIRPTMYKQIELPDYSGKLKQLVAEQ